MLFLSLRRRSRPGGFRPLPIFLAATLGLSGWLAYQAVDAAASHRRSAESVLRDYAMISATQLAQIGRANLSDVLDEVFSPVRRRSRRANMLTAEAVGWEIDDAMREQRCRCRAFRSPVALFRIDLSTGVADFVPDSLSSEAKTVIIGRVTSGTSGTGRRSTRLATLGPGVIIPEAAAVGYMISNGPDDAQPTAFGFVVRIEAIEELFREWYDRHRLLPAPIAGGLPNDSLLYVRVEGEGEVGVFSSPVPYPTHLAASSDLGTGFEGMVVHAAIRPDAASQLIIGGLPSSRLPLLVVLFLLTVGLGIAALRQLRREQEFQHLRDDFISGVSHELRTPLAQIRMFAELQESGKLRLEEDRARAVSVIHREARKLTYLVENILHFSRLRRTDGRTPNSERLDLADAVEDAVEGFAPLARSHGVRIEVDVPDGLTVHAHREVLARIMANLIDNAIKYGPRAQTIRIDAKQDARVVRLSVADEGPGVPVPERERVWEPYRRLVRDVQGNVPGTGIGLSIVRRLTELSDGRTWIEDADEGGARFVVELPLAPSETGSPDLDPDLQRPAAEPMPAP